MLLYNVSLGKPTRCASKIIVWDAAPIGHEKHAFWKKNGWSKDGVSEFTQSNPVTQLFWQHVRDVQGTSVKWHLKTWDVSQLDHQDPKNYGCSGGVPLPRFRWQRSDPLAQHGHEPGQSGSCGSGGVVNLDQLEAYEETQQKWGCHGISTNNQASGTDRIWYVYTVYHESQPKAWAWV